MLYPVKWNLFNIEHLEVEGTVAACWPLCQILDVVSVNTDVNSLFIFTCIYLCEHTMCKEGESSILFYFLHFF